MEGEEQKKVAEEMYFSAGGIWSVIMTVVAFVLELEMPLWSELCGLIKFHWKKEKLTKKKKKASAQPNHFLSSRLFIIRLRTGSFVFVVVGSFCSLRDTRETPNRTAAQQSSSDPHLAHRSKYRALRHSYRHMIQFISFFFFVLCNIGQRKPSRDPLAASGSSIPSTTTESRYIFIMK